MLQNKTQWLAAAVFLGVPLALVGCGGGGSSNSSPRATATPVTTFFATPTPTPAAAPTVFSITANLTQTSGALPFAVRYTDGTATIYTQLGYNIVTANLGEASASGGFAQPAFGLTLGTLGTLKTGDSFTLSSNSTGSDDKTLVFNDTRDTANIQQYQATGGTFRITSLVNNPATTTGRATATVRFSLSNVTLRLNSPNQGSDLILNATGQFTAENLGEQQA